MRIERNENRQPTYQTREMVVRFVFDAPTTGVQACRDLVVIEPTTTGTAAVDLEAWLNEPPTHGRCRCSVDWGTGPDPAPVRAATVDTGDGIASALITPDPKKVRSVGASVDAVVEKLIDEHAKKGTAHASKPKTSRGRRTLPHR